MTQAQSSITSLYAGNGGKPIWNQFISPVGLLLHTYHDKPQLEWLDERNTVPKIDDKTGFQLANFKVTLAWLKSELDTSLLPLRELAGKTVGEAWGPLALQDQWFRLEAFLRDGDNPEHNTKRKEYLLGMLYLNFKCKATPVLVNGEHKGAYSGGPQIIDAYTGDLQPTDIYPGCRARVSGIMFGTEYMGKKFISTRLENIQRDVLPASGQFERIGGGGREDARTQFQALATPPAGSLGVLGGGIRNIL